MTFDVIVSIQYIKESGEYFVKRRNADTGKTIVSCTNTLSETEREWATNCKWFQEFDNCVWWVN